MFMVGCSSDEGNLADGQEGLDEVLDLDALNSDVPITFGVIDGEATTRATVQSEELKANGIGVFMLARMKRSTWSPNWLSDNVVNRRLNIWLDNVSANIVYEDAVHLSKFEWADNKQQHFYPSLQRYSYEFVGYYPRTENIEYTTMTGTTFQAIYAYIDIDGSTDVMYAHAVTPADKPKAFSSEYYKDEPTADPPHFQFSHKLARMQFKVRLTSDAATVGNYYVDSVYLENMSYKTKLQVAYKGSNQTDGSAPINGGQLYSVDASTAKKNFYLKTINDTSIADENYLLTDEPQPIGDAIMFFPCNNTLSLRVVIRDDNGSRYSPTNAIPVTPPSGGWQAGVTYPISIKLTDPVKVHASASLLDYTSYIDLGGAEQEVEDKTQEP